MTAVVTRDVVKSMPIIAASVAALQYFYNPIPILASSQAGHIVLSLLLGAAVAGTLVTASGFAAGMGSVPGAGMGISTGQTPVLTPGVRQSYDLKFLAALVAPLAAAVYLSPYYLGQPNDLLLIAQFLGVYSLGLAISSKLFLNALDDDSAPVSPLYYGLLGIANQFYDVGIVVGGQTTTLGSRTDRSNYAMGAAAIEADLKSQGYVE